MCRANARHSCTVILYHGLRQPVAPIVHNDDDDDDDIILEGDGNGVTEGQEGERLFDLCWWVSLFAPIGYYLSPDNVTLRFLCLKCILRGVANRKLISQSDAFGNHIFGAVKKK